jgi:hypothetical protein
VSIDYDEALELSRPGPAFSNSTHWEVWAAGWCNRCTRDSPFRNGISNHGCPLITIAVCNGRIPAQWWTSSAEDDSLGDYSCIEFRPPGGGGGEPRPKPEPRGMDGLFPRPERQTRMLTPPPRPAPVLITVIPAGEIL